MLSVNLLDRLIQHRDYDRLLQSLADNGMVMPLGLRVRLSDGPAAPMALALRRLVELTYGPTAQTRELAADLLALQNPDGSFSGAEPGCGDPLATAAAAAALGRVIREHPGEGPALEPAYRRALGALGQMQDVDNRVGFAGASDRSDADRRLITAFILFLLTGDAAFRSAVRFADLMNGFDDHADELDEPTRQLWTMARMDLAVPPVAAQGRHGGVVLACAAA